MKGMTVSAAVCEPCLCDVHKCLYSVTECGCELWQRPRQHKVVYVKEAVSTAHSNQELGWHRIKNKSSFALVNGAIWNLQIFH